MFALLPYYHCQENKLNYLFNTAFNTICATFGNYDANPFSRHRCCLVCLVSPVLFSHSSIIVTCHQLDCLPDKWHKMLHWLLPHIEKTAVQCSDEIIVTSAGLRNYFFSTVRHFNQIHSQCSCQLCRSRRTPSQ